MFFLNSPLGSQQLIFSASDLVAASECQYRTLRILDEKLFRTAKAEFGQDEMLQRAAQLGDDFEAAILAGYEAEFGLWDAVRGTGVKRIERAELSWPALVAKRDETLHALRTGADVVFQATFFDGELVGFADFLLRQPDGSYAVHDTKLARHARVGALLQLAAYADQLQSSKIPVHPTAVLKLGDKSESRHPLPDLLPVYGEHRDRFRALAARHRSQPRPVAWLQAGVGHCGRCDYCAVQVREHQDLLLVHGMGTAQRRKLRQRGITTVAGLAELPAPPSGPLVRLRDQARMQLGLEPTAHAAPTANAAAAGSLKYKVLETISKLPEPSPGDIFFDFEGDPLWQDSQDGSWGLEYLFGSIEAPPAGGTGAAANAALKFTPFWAHSRDGERAAFEAFLRYVEQRRKEWPDMHVYHYAPYEKTALRNLSLRHGSGWGEEVVDDWLRTGLLVDLLDTVRQSVRISASSYSIKKLEPFYMDQPRDGDVTDAGASVVAYAHYCQQRDEALGADASDTAAHQARAAATLAAIRAYNREDCVATLRLRDWLFSIGAAKQLPNWNAGSGKHTLLRERKASYEPGSGEAAINAFTAALREDKEHKPSSEERAIELVAAAASYHRREDKQFWWGHFDRLGKGPGDWAEERNMLSIESVEVVADWAKPEDKPRARTQTRTLKITGTATEGSDFRPGSNWFGMHNAPLPEGMAQNSAVLADTPASAAPLRGGLFNVTVIEDVSNPATPELTALLVVEKSTTKVQPYGQFPCALTPDQPVSTTSIRAALAELADTVGSNLPRLAKHPGVDILRRSPPRLTSGGPLPSAVLNSDGHSKRSHDYVTAITDAVRKLDNSYLAVQGPPGTGKTHVGSHVIAALVRGGWKIGVVGQSHAVVENMLRAAVEKAGVDPECVGKKRHGDHTVPWKTTDDKQFGQLLSREGGALIGGTAWTMTGANVPAGSLDLLVIDEAGQYSLANTLAVSRAARRLLLLGDPRQLPQVTQGSHPAPVDESALGWLSADHATLPADLGYFLADSWRMHPELCAAVSRLSYDGKLQSAPAAGQRHLAGKAPGVEMVLVHTPPANGDENKQSSPAEAAMVVAQVREHLGLAWTPGQDQAPRVLTQEDILVVAAYNAQVHLVRASLDAAGMSGVRAGTVDKFQGQEAPVVLVTMACADPAAAPRGMEFLLNRNRINVAVSRGQWRAVVIRSPSLSNFMPARAEAMAELGAFIGLCGPVPMLHGPAAGS
ncbi:TM0106 family RecB-like putative nuclease [Specibacter sp. NPDC057265]|uniref:TM0106 family RecB-like putative nuclease n=1 Tax=Specibacter sp. NPDC057265 TaxID=3346075 RepID=UPI0036413291